MGRNQEPGPAHNKGDHHFGNFSSAVRSRNRGEINAEIEQGAISCTLTHLGNIACRVGRTLYSDSRTVLCIGDTEANKMSTRAYRAPFVVPERV